MGRSRNIKLACLMVILAFAAAILFYGPWQTQEKAPALVKVIPKVDLQAQDILYTEAGEGDVKYEIRAKTLQYQKKDNAAEFESVKVKLMLSKGKTYYINSDRGVYDTEKKNIVMMGNVVVQSDAGDRITTDKLYYNNEARKIYSDSPVTMVNKNIEVKGVGLSLLIDKKQLTLRSHVKATIKSN